MGNSNSKLLPTEQKTSAQQNCTVQQNYTLSGRSCIQTSTTIITAEFLNKIIEENEDIKKLMVQINNYDSQEIAQQDCFERRLLLKMTHIIDEDRVSKEYVAGLFRRALTNIVQELEKSPNPIKLIEEKGAVDNFEKLKQEKAKLESEIQLLIEERKRISKSVSQFENLLKQELELKITNASPLTKSYEMLHKELKRSPNR